MKNDQLYANGRISVLSTKLMGADKFSRLADCNSTAEALRVLSECNFGSGDNDEQLLATETDNILLQLQELCTDKNAVQYFLCRYCYHNAKVLMKRKYMRIQSIDGCFLQTGQDVQLMSQAFVQDDYSLCSKHMAEACDQIDAAFADGDRSPRTIDFLLDKAMFAEMKLHARKSVGLVKQLFEWEADCTNLIVLCRLKSAGANKEESAQWLIDGGKVKKQTLSQLWDNPQTELPQQYQRLWKLCQRQLAAAEEAKKQGASAIIEQNADMLTIQPAVKFFYDRLAEADKVRKLLVAIKRGADSLTLKKIAGQSNAEA